MFIFGFTGIFGKLISIAAVNLVWYRLLIAVLVLVIFIGIKNRNLLNVSRNNLLKFIATGSIIALHWVYFYLSIKNAPVSVAVVCLSSSTFFTALIEPLFFKRKIRIYEMLLGIVIIISLYLIFKINSSVKLGMTYGIISAFLASIFPVLNGLLAQKNDAYTVTFYELLGGWMVLSIYLLFTGVFTAPFFNISNVDIGWLLLLGVICTAFTFVIGVSIMRTISPFTVVLSINLEPVYTIILAAFLFKEYQFLSISFYIGTAFILSTIVINALLKKRFEKRSVSPA